MPPKSGVRNPLLITFLTALSIIKPISERSKEYLNIKATLSIIPNGFALPDPAISGAEPCTGS